MKGVKKILTKAQKTPAKKIKPALTSKRHSCCFSGWCLKPFVFSLYVTSSISSLSRLV